MLIWPDMLTLLHASTAVFVTIGQVKGQTLLPLPPSDIAHQEPVVLHDKDKIHILEGAVITWTRQIKDVLKADSESALKVGRISAVTMRHLPCQLLSPYDSPCNSGLSWSAVYAV